MASQASGRGLRRPTSPHSIAVARRQSRLTEVVLRCTFSAGLLPASARPARGAEVLPVFWSCSVTARVTCREWDAVRRHLALPRPRGDMDLGSGAQGEEWLARHGQPVGRGEGLPAHTGPEARARATVYGCNLGLDSLEAVTDTRAHPAATDTAMRARQTVALVYVAHVVAHCRGRSHRRLRMLTPAVATTQDRTALSVAATRPWLRLHAHMFLKARRRERMHSAHACARCKRATRELGTSARTRADARVGPW